MKCSKGATKHRYSKGGGHPGDYKRSIRGHTWKKTEYGRCCEKCGKQIRIQKLIKKT